MRRVFLRGAICQGLLLVGTVILANLDFAQNKPEVEAQKAGEQWLALIDAGKYGESWDDAAPSFKTALSRQDWIGKVTAARKPLGRVVSRRLTKSSLVKDPPNAPPGDYVGLQYQSSFQNLKSAVEALVPVLDKDGRWRVTSYIVSRQP